MTKRALLIGILAIAGVFALSAGTSPVEGRWKTTFNFPEGDVEVIYTFKVEEEKLTGMASSYMGDAYIYNGKVGDNEYSFDLDVGGYMVGHKLKFEQEVLKMTVEYEWNLYEFTLEPVKEN